MDVNKIKQQLSEQYPNKGIFENEIEDVVTEILCEVEPSSEHPEYSLAIAVIDRSLPHHHKVTVETYKVLKGKLTLHVEDDKVELHEGQEYTIPINKVHWAEGDETWVEVSSKPGWTFEDHILRDK